MLKLKYVAVFAAALALMAPPAMAAKKVLRIQSVLPTSADEVVMLKEFGKDVAALTNGSLTIEVLPAGAVVGPRDIMDAVDAGLVDTVEVGVMPVLLGDGVPLLPPGGRVKLRLTKCSASERSGMVGLEYAVEPQAV